MSIAIASTPESVWELSDLASAGTWHKSAPAAVRRGYGSGREADGWKAWQQHLARRSHRGRHGPRAGDTLAWTDAEISFTPPTKQGLRQWLREVTESPWNLDYALAALGWCRHLPELAGTLPAADWWTLLEHLVQTAADASGSPLDLDKTDADPLVWQLLAGELPLTLAHLFPELAACRALRGDGRRALSAGLADLLDGKGLPHAKHFPQLRQLLACWTRCRTLSDRKGHRCWSKAAEVQYQLLARNMLRLARRDGSLVFGESAADHQGVDLLLAAVVAGGRKTDRLLAERFFPESDLARASGRGGPIDRTVRKARGGDKKLPKPAVHSEWAAAAVLRSDWSRSGPRLSVAYPGASCRVELACGKDVLWSGVWKIDLKLDGVRALPSSEWSELCWVSDGDVDYLELEIDLGDGLRVQRHFVLAHKDRFLLLADAVLASRPSRLHYHGTLPLCRNVTWQTSREASGGALAAKRPRAFVIPLALPGALAADQRGLHLQQTAEGRALLAPLWFDLDRGRFQQPHIWRPLTVAETWVKQPADAAAGYRVAIGKRQWLIYRSFNGSANRSLLGHNLSSEMLVARFDRQGEVHSLIEIE